MKRFICALKILLVSLIFISCSNGEDDYRFYLDDKFDYAVCPETEDGTNGFESTPEDAMELFYMHLDKMEYCNLYDIVGGDGKYLWLKAEFILPEELKGEDLSIVIPYLHFADELYMNGRYIDDYGFMGEDDFQEAGYTSHLFDIPHEFINQNGNNVVLIKVYALGMATISPGVFLGFREDAWSVSDNASFWQSRIYVFFEGGMFIVCIFFLILFCFVRTRQYIIFAFINIFSILFFSNFFMGDLPWVGFHGGIPYFVYKKICSCICFFGMEYFLVLFIFDFLGIKHKKIAIIMRSIVSTFCVLFTIILPDFQSLIKYTPLLLFLSGADLVVSIVMIIGLCFYRAKNKQRSAKLLLIGLLPIMTTLVADFIVKYIFRIITIPYFAMFGWQITIYFFFLNFCINYRSLSIRNEYLNTELENEVEIQTRKLSIANKQLEHEIQVSKDDMKTAAIVQSKLFRLPEQMPLHWDIAVEYKPLSIVSGDLFDFYCMGNTLYGASLFDASGHGVAASLITMLVENIIHQGFRDANIYGEDIGVTLERINENFIAAKGEIDNYLTGLLLSIQEMDDGICKVSFANAAHPYPLLYSSLYKTAEELLPFAEDPSCGPVGMDLIEVHYSPINFKMKKDDVLVMFSDGLVEAMNEERNEFGRKAILEILEQSEPLNANQIKDKIIKALSDHVYPLPLNDDVTVIVMKRV